MRHLLLAIVGIVSVLLTSTTLQAAQKPNIVLILADDLGYGDPQCYNDQSKIPTPHIDRVASEGLRLTDAHTPSSVCTPTRYGLLTGRFCWRSGLKRSVLWPWDPPLIEADRLTLPKILKQQGYATACIGKWHLGWDWPLDGGGFVSDEFSGVTMPVKPRRAFGERIDFTRPTQGGPLDRGFDHYFGDDVPNFPPYCFIEDHRTLGVPSVAKPQGMFGHPGPALAGWDLSLVLPTLAQRAAAYVEAQAKTPARPFFLYVPLTAPHTPIAPSPHFTGKSQAGAYGDFVHEVDWCVGQVLSALERTGAADNTLVIFTSDNGSPQRDGTNMSGPTGSVPKKFGHDPSRPWRGMKSDIWEAGHRVPFIVRWPGHVPANQTSAEPIILTDLMRSIATLVGYKLPRNSAEDSFDISPVLFGREFSAPIHGNLIHHSGNGMFAIRQGHWKLIRGKTSGGFTRYKAPKDAPLGQLYDLKADPAEQNNLYTARPEVVECLGAELDRLVSRGRTWPTETAHK